MLNLQEVSFLSTFKMHNKSAFSSVTRADDKFYLICHFHLLPPNIWKIWLDLLQHNYCVRFAPCQQVFLLTLHTLALFHSRTSEAHTERKRRKTKVNTAKFKENGCSVCDRSTLKECVWERERGIGTAWQRREMNGNVCTVWLSTTTTSALCHIIENA